MERKDIVGDLINFRGIVYAPLNEQGVVFLFGKVIEDLGMYVELIRTGYPDCIGRRYRGKGWEKVYIEFEYVSSNFRDHKHDEKECDIIVCWEHDWPDCPLEVIELKDIITRLPNEPIGRPSPQIEEHTLEDLLKREKVKPKIRLLFHEFDRQVKSLNDEIWSKVAKTTVSFYSPERVFLYTYFRQTSIRVEMFTRGKNIAGVRQDPNAKSGAKWGSIIFKTSEELPQVLKAVEKSYKHIREAIKQNEPTGWYAQVEPDDNGIKFNR